NDYCYRAGHAGFELAIADDAYVFHAKSRSYGGAEGRRALAREHYQVFMAKHGEANVQPLVQQLERDESLAPLRATVAEAVRDNEALAGVIRSRPRSLRVGFLLPSMAEGGSGGAHSVYQETRAMQDLGIDARIAVARTAWARARDTYRDADTVFVP